MRELKAIMKLHDTTQRKLATIIGCRETSMNHKLAGKADFKVGEIKKIVKYYNLTPEQTFNIFIKEK